MTDFTHDTCMQKYKTGSIGLVGMHFDASNWRNTQIPLMLNVAKGETAEAYASTLRFLIKCFNDKFGIDLLARIDIIFSDGSEACAAALREVMPNVKHLICLEHAKDNLGKNYTKTKKWLNSSGYKIV